MLWYFGFTLNTPGGRRHLAPVCVHGRSDGKTAYEQKEGHASQNVETPVFQSSRRLVILL